MSSPGPSHLWLKKVSLNRPIFNFNFQIVIEMFYNMIKPGEDGADDESEEDDQQKGM